MKINNRKKDFFVIEQFRSKIFSNCTQMFSCETVPSAVGNPIKDPISVKNI